MSPSDSLSTSLEKNKARLHQLLPLQKSFDFVTRDLSLGDIPCFFVGLNGLCDQELILKIFSEFSLPEDSTPGTTSLDTIPKEIIEQFLYTQVTAVPSFQRLVNALLVGSAILLVGNYGQGLILDTRDYPDRDPDESDTEKVIRGAKDGFVESIVTNCCLIRRRLRSSRLTFAAQSVGNLSHTDVAVAYMEGLCDPKLLSQVQEKLRTLSASALTMGVQSLKELLVKKSMFHPMPDFYLTQRPDVACSYLTEGYILLLVDNSPFALVLPCTVFQFTQSPEDYYRSPAVGTYLRLVRFLCLLVSLFFMPLFLLFSLNPGWLPEILHPMITSDVSPLALFIYVLFVELGLDLFKYASAHTASDYSGALSIVGGLLIGDMAINLQWASVEVIFYGAVTLLATLSLPSVELSDAVRLYRFFLILLTGLFSAWGFGIGLALILLSLITTPVFGKKSYFWPLFPFHWEALRTLLFRYPTFKAQPEKKQQQK